MARRVRRRQGDRLPFLNLLPNLITIAGLSAGLTALRFTLDQRYDAAAVLIIAAALLDSLDGLIARRLDAASAFGAELDSLSDFVCFGVAPGLLVFQFAMQDMRGLGWVFALVYIICCCLRLARFNVHRNDPPSLGRPHFTGVPAPAGALLAMLPVFLSLSGVLDLSGAGWLAAPWLAAVGALMISRLRTLSPKAIRLTRDQAKWVLVAAAFVAGLIFTRFWLLMALASLAYVASLVWSAVEHLRARPRGLPENEGRPDGT